MRVRSLSTGLDPVGWHSCLFWRVAFPSTCCPTRPGYGRDVDRSRRRVPFRSKPSTLGGPSVSRFGLRRRDLSCFSSNNTGQVYPFFAFRRPPLEAPDLSFRWLCATGMRLFALLSSCRTTRSAAREPRRGSPHAESSDGAFRPWQTLAGRASDCEVFSTERFQRPASLAVGAELPKRGTPMLPLGTHHWGFDASRHGTSLPISPANRYRVARLPILLNPSWLAPRPSGHDAPVSGHAGACLDGPRRAAIWETRIAF